MLPTTIHTPPSLGDFTLLSDYQSTTPATFDGGKPVLHFHAAGAKAWLAKDQQSALPIFPADSPVFEGDSDDMVAQDDIELFVNSETLTIFNRKSSTGVQIPYPSIALHAMQHKAEPTTTSTSTSTSDADAGSGPESAADAAKAPCILLQLDLSDGGADDETFDTVQLTLVPPPSSTDLSSPAQAGSAAARTEQEKLFDAITACQNLHPDPVDDGEDDDDDGEDYADRIIFESNVDGSGEGIEGLPGVLRGSASGGLPPPMPGSSGWITAENVGDFFDADGNWIGGGGGGENGDEDEEGGEELGEGAGRVRGRDELNGHGDGVEEDGENKRTRTG